MTNQLLLNTLHLSLGQIKKQLKESSLAYYEPDILYIEEVINQYPKLSHLPLGRLASKKDEPGMLQTIAQPIQNLTEKLGKELKQDIHCLETEMHGTEIFSDYELKRMYRYIAKKELQNELQKMLTLLTQEGKQFKESTRIDLYVLRKD